MALQSRLFKNDPRLNKAAASDPAHVLIGDKGSHVARIQTALAILDDAAIAKAELDCALYGPSTAAAVLAYKEKRNIVNRSYQTKADDIVGKMTVAALDKELLRHEREDIKPCGRQEIKSFNPYGLPRLYT